MSKFTPLGPLFTGKKHDDTVDIWDKRHSWLNEFHRINVARQHEAFAPAHSLLGLVACASEEIGELASVALGITKEKKRKLHHTNDDLLDAVADAITYLSLIAERGGCTDLQGLLARTFNMVSERAGSNFKVPLTVGQDDVHPKFSDAQEPCDCPKCDRPDTEVFS
jgi:NTP pyrophosphatase (non-canonical NTP hydrolase)